MPQPNLTNLIRAGDRVTILVPAGRGRQGQEWKAVTGRAVMPGPAGFVLNLGGPYGRPGIASSANLVAIKRGNKVIFQAPGEMAAPSDDCLREM